MAQVDESCLLLAHETLEVPESAGRCAAILSPRKAKGTCGGGMAEADALSQLSKESYEHLRRKADGYLVGKDYLRDVQTELSRKVREEVVSWLVDTGHAIALSSQIIAIAVNCLDRFLALRCIPRGMIGDVAAAALLICAKVHDRVPPPLSYLALYTDCKPESIVITEAAVLDQLRWQVNGVPPNEFAPYMIHRMTRLGYDVSEKLVEMLLDVSLLVYDLVQSRPCTIAAACVLLASELQAPHAEPCPRRRDAFADSVDLDPIELARVKDLLHDSFQEFFSGCRS